MLSNQVQVKICGLTRVDEAVACAQAGARAIGYVFYPQSPRCVGAAKAADIRRALPPEVACVGVFVDETFEAVMRIVGRTGLSAVQLHGSEPPGLVDRLRREGLCVIKALFADRAPGFDKAGEYSGAVFLAECGRGALPGGNAQAWDWSKAGPIGERHPLILAGGLTPENAAQAVRAACPDAVDVSSVSKKVPDARTFEKSRNLLRPSPRPPQGE